MTDGAALFTMQKTSRIKIFLKIELDGRICRAVGESKIDDTQIKEQINDGQQHLACIENASLLIR